MSSATRTCASSMIDRVDGYLTSISMKVLDPFPFHLPDMGSPSWTENCSSVVGTVFVGAPVLQKETEASSCHGELHHPDNTFC
jgi:hypothetical protein